MPVKFPLPDPQDHHSLKPGSVLVRTPSNATRESEPKKSDRLTEAIAGARAAATQFSKGNNFQPQPTLTGNPISSRTRNKSKEGIGFSTSSGV